MRDPKDIVVNGTALADILRDHRKWLYGKSGKLAYLQRANLQRANLQGADLQGADLQGADLQGAKNTELAAALTTICPEGDIIGWKKLAGGLIAKMLIPAAAKRSNATGRKCRAEWAQVLEIWDGTTQVQSGVSSWDGSAYTVGESVYPDKWDDDRWDECSNGIHFFITRPEAENYNI